MEYLVLKWMHVISSTLLFGTGIGSAFYFLATTLSRNVQAIAAVARMVVRAELLFTATTAVLQPLTGLWLIHWLGLPWSTPWVRASLVGYGLAMACWLPVVWIQMRLRDLAAQAAWGHTELPPAYWKLFKAWIALGIPAFFLFLSLFWLMIAKPDFSE